MYVYRVVTEIDGEVTRIDGERSTEIQQLDRRLLLSVYRIYGNM
jgi:hypothetical protein